jgi:hypothetical protein
MRMRLLLSLVEGEEGKCLNLAEHVSKPEVRHSGLAYTICDLGFWV